MLPLEKSKIKAKVDTSRASLSYPRMKRIALLFFIPAICLAPARRLTQADFAGVPASRRLSEHLKRQFANGLETQIFHRVLR